QEGPGAGGFDREEPAKFTGHERDFAGGQGREDSHYTDYMHARDYSPVQGRFLSVDPAMDVKSNLKNPQGWNRYAYVVNNPIRYVDPDGRWIQLGGSAEEQQKLLELIQRNLAAKDRNLVTIG